MESDHRRRLATPLDSLSDWLILEAAVARAAAGSAVAVECQDASGERVVDRIQSTHSVDPSRHRSGPVVDLVDDVHMRSEEHTSELQSLMRISYAVFCLKKKTKT